MQNTSRIQSIPNTLIKNFFISGVSQGTLANKIRDRYSVNIVPEVLFSMYSPKEIAACYLQVIYKDHLYEQLLQFVFPENIEIQYKPIEPKFYTFMSTDSSGFNSFFHCLIFYEEINEAELAYDYDLVKKVRHEAYLDRKKRDKLEKYMKKRKQGKDGTAQGVFEQAQKVQRQMQLRRKESTAFLCANDIAKHKQLEDKIDNSIITEVSPTTPISSKKEQMMIRQKQELKAQSTQQQIDVMLSDIRNPQGAGQKPSYDPSRSVHQSFYKGLAVSNKDKTDASPVQKSWLGPTTKQIQEKQAIQYRKRLDAPKYSDQSSVNAFKIDPLFNPSPTTNTQREMEFSSPGRTDSSAIYGNNDTSVTFSNMAQMQTASRAQMKIVCTVSPDGKTPAQQQKDIAIDYASPDKHQIMFKKQQTDMSTNSNNIQLSMNSGVYNACNQSDDLPPATPLGASQCDRRQQIDKLYEKKLYIPVAFVIETETEFHDEFRQMLISLFEMIRSPDKVTNGGLYRNKLLSFAELTAHLAFLKTIPAPPFNSEYHIEFLDQTITLKENPFTEIPNKNLNAIKILFDCLDLVLVSSQFSLQFYVAEALKQLLFPLTWQNSYIQPGSEKLKGLCDGTITMIYTASGYAGDFDFFDGISPNVAVCDIDACYTNNVELPPIHDEQMYIRILNIMKNCRVNEYDWAYPKQSTVNDDDFVQEVRKTFFKILQPYLINIEDCIDKSADSLTASFDKYFIKQKYLSGFDDHKVQQKFAEGLLESSQFVHFCDDYYSEDLNNFHQFQAILRARGDLNFPSPKTSGVEKNKFQRASSEIEDTPVKFHFRMPQNSHRAMIFEMIEYMIQDTLRKREEDISRASDKEVYEGLMDNDKSYLQILKDIKEYYAEKLKQNTKQVEQSYSPRAKQTGKFNMNEQRLHNEVTKDEEGKLDYRQKGFARHSRNSSQGSANFRTQGQADNNGLDIIKQKFPYGQDRLILRQNTLQSNSFISGKDSDLAANTSKPNTNNNSGVTTFLHSSTLPRQQQKNQQMEYTKNGAGNGQNGTTTNANRAQGKKQFLDMLHSRDDVSQSLIQGSMNDSFDEMIEQERIQHLEVKVVRLIYGKQGLLNILGHLYGHLNDTQRKQVNYYFSLRDQLHPTSLKKTEQCTLGGYNAILEDPGREDEQTPKNLIRSPMKQRLSSNSLGAYSRFGQFVHQAQRTATGLQPLKYSSSCLFGNNHQWFTVEGTDKNMNHKKVRRTYQYLLTITKIYESFEFLETGYSLIFFELIKFPTSAIEFFPLQKCQLIWKNLTKMQKNQVYQKHGIKKNKKDSIGRPNECIKLILKDPDFNGSPNKTRFETMASTNGNSPLQKQQNADERLFQQASLDSPYASRRANSSSSQSIKNNISPTICKKIDEKRMSTQKMATSQQTMVMKNVKDTIKQRLNLTMKIRKVPSQLGSQDMTMCVHKKATADELSLFTLDNTKSMTARAGNGHGIELRKAYSGLQNQSSTLNYDLSGRYLKRDTKIIILNHPEAKSAKIMDKMVEFWQKYYKYVDKSGKFQEAQLESIKVDLYEFQRILDSLKKKNPDFKGDDISQQVFFINIHNFMILHKLAILMYSEPESIEKLKNYNMWQHLLQNTNIHIAGIKINAYYIQHAILRQNLSKPDISNFRIDIDYIDNDFFKVQVPNKFIQFGIFLPLNGQPDLQVFRKETYESQLKKAASFTIQRKMKFEDGNRLIILPKIMDWYSKDYCGSGFYDKLDFLTNKLYIEDTHKRSILRKIKRDIDQDMCLLKEYHIEYKCYGWSFNPLRLAHYFAKPLGAINE